MSQTDPAVTTPKKLMTADEFWEFCQRPESQDKRLELIRGEVVEVSRPTRRHSAVQANVGYVLETYARQRGVGYTAVESGVVLEEDPGTVVGPDAAYYTDAATFEELHPKWGEEPPVLAVEILSPNDKMSKVNAKIRDHLHNGVKLVWLVDFEERKVTVYRPDRTMDVLDETAELTGGDELPGFRCQVADFFRLPGERVTQPPPSPPSS